MAPLEMASLEIQVPGGMVRPGHKLLIVCGPQMTAEQAGELMEDLERELPGVRVLMLKGPTQVLIYEPNAP